MYNSKNKQVFDLILEKLNNNTQGVTFDGNFMFEFSQAGTNNFNIKSLSELDFVETKVTPVVDVQSIQIPFVEKNNRDDWEREFYLAIEIPKGTNAVTGDMIIEFEDTNAEYQAILETIETLQTNLTFIDGDKKYSFKVKEPTKVGVFTYNGQYYQILALTFNLTSLETGYFGNETEVYLGEFDDVSFGKTSAYLIDKVDFTPVMGKTMRNASSINTVDETTKPNKRIWSADIVVNLDTSIPGVLFYKEMFTTADIDQKYKIIISNPTLNTDVGQDLDAEFNVYITTMSQPKGNNRVDQATFRLERA